jgi:hypothetical protein
MAVTPAGGATGEKSVDFTVGGTATTTGSGNTDENVMDFTSSSVEFNPIKADYSDSSKFVNIAGRTIKTGNTDSQINVDENISVVADVELQTLADGYKPGETVAKIGQNGLVYSINFGTGVPYYTSLTQLDDNTQYNVKVPILGKEYVIDEATATKLVLYADTTAETIEVGQTISVAGVGSYAGKTLTLSLDALTLTGTAASYKAKWSLMDGTTVLSTKETAAPYEVRDLFGTDYFTTSVYMSAAGLNATTSKYYATVRTGTSRLEIRSGEVFPYDSTKVTNPQWKAYFRTNDTDVAGADGKILSVQIKNNWAYTQNKTESSTSKLMLGVGDALKLTNDYAKVEYKGLQTKSMAKATIGGSSAVITDSKGVARDIPLVIALGSGTNTFTIAGSTFLADLNETPTGSGAFGLRYWLKSKSSETSPWGDDPTGDAGTDYTDVYLGATKDVNTDSGVNFTIDPDWKSAAVTYYLGGDEASHQYWLFLAAQEFDLDSKSDTEQGEIVFAGTEVDQNRLNGTYAIAGTPTSVKSVLKVDLNYYLPDQSTYNVLTSERANSTMVVMGTTSDANSNDGKDVGMTGSFRAPTDGDVYQYVSEWVFNEDATMSANTTPTTYDVNFWINNQTGYLITSTDNKTKLSAATAEVISTNFTLDEYTTAAASKLTKATNNYGTEISVSGGVATIMMPEETRKAMFYVGSTDTVTTNVGGEPFKAVKAGQTKTTTTGTTVTVDAIAGASGAGVTVNDVGNIVKLDSQSTYGKSILVGGWLVNSKVAATMQVDGVALNERVQAKGDYVAAVVDGSIVVAGWLAEDTGTAAQALIAALDAL